MLSTTFIKTPIGTIKIVSKNGVIISSKFVDKKINSFTDNTIREDIDNYFSGASDNFQSTYKLIGTDFQIKVWKEICKIPYGETLSYGEIAKRIGDPKSCRAVANACGQNQLAIFVPCHRVVGKNNMGGYKWGLDKKQWLLDLRK